MGVENYIFWSEIGSGFGEPGGTPFPGVSPPGVLTSLFLVQWEIFLEFNIVQGNICHSMARPEKLFRLANEQGRKMGSFGGMKLKYLQSDRQHDQ